jgi:hypothetical protein
MADKKTKDTKREDIIDGATGKFQDQRDSMPHLPGWESKEEKANKKTKGK